MNWLLNPNNTLPILNGLIGDKLAEKNDKWAIQMAFRSRGRNLPMKDLDRNFMKSTIVFVHGLMADERIWKPFTSLERDFSVLYLRYNSGLHIFENGKLLAALLNALCDQFRIKQLYLAGHSMGGLVIRSACFYGMRSYWVGRIPAIFLIAVPNAGAPLEKVGHISAAFLNGIAKWHMGTIGNLLEQRSHGIKDLRLGAMREEDLKTSPSTSHTPVPPNPGTQYHILVGTLSNNEDSLMAKYFGDGLVPTKSAMPSTLLKVSTVKVFVRSGHNSILSNPEVLQYVQRVLGEE